MARMDAQKEIINYIANVVAPDHSPYIRRFEQMSELGALVTKLEDERLLRVLLYARVQLARQNREKLEFGDAATLEGCGGL